MSRVDKFNGITITVEGSNTSYHSYDDWGLYVTNTDCIGEPELLTNYVEVPGRDGLIDMTEVVSGRPIYKSRQIKVKLAGIRNKVDWDSVISSFRNHINGRICRITFDNDIAYFWRGRVEIKDFSSVMNMGVFVVDIPNADPYKYNIQSSSEPWLWDSFDFEYGEISDDDEIVIDGSETVTIPAGNMYVVPEIVVQMTSASLTVTYHDTTYALKNGTNRIPQILINGDAEEELYFVGDATVQLVYRGGSL